MIDPEHKLPVARQAQLLELSRSSVYYQPEPTSESDLALMRILDRWHLEYPFAGSRLLYRYSTKRKRGHRGKSNSSHLHFPLNFSRWCQLRNSSFG